MNKENIKYNYRLLCTSVIIIFVTAGVFFFFWDTTKNIIRIILEAHLTYFLLWTITILIFLLHYFRHKDKEVRSETIITKKFGSFLDNALGGIVYGTTITTSLTLLKGLFIQKFFGDIQYFTEFNNIDLITIFSVMIFLLYFGVVKVVEIAKETYKVEHTAKVMNESKNIVTFKETSDNNIFTKQQKSSNMDNNRQQQ